MRLNNVQTVVKSFFYGKLITGALSKRPNTDGRQSSEGTNTQVRFIWTNTTFDVFTIEAQLNTQRVLNK